MGRPALRRIPHRLHHPSRQPRVHSCSGEMRLPGSAADNLQGTPHTPVCPPTICGIILLKSYRRTEVLPMETTRLSTKGQIVLPKALRTSRAWKPGTEFIVEE